MNPHPANALDRDAIVEQLSRLDSSDPGDPATGESASTVKELKAELDTLIGELRQPVGPEPFADETGLRRAQELVLAIGLEPESASNNRDQRPELGRIGPYELLEKLGEGGMGAVYKALHSSLEKVVALKVLPRDRLNPQAIARFKREMKAVGKLDHPNIVRATDAGEADGDHFLVMEYVEGVDLAELLRRVGPLPAAEACELVRQAAVGLQHAHQRGMVHRDIKPNNIMLAWSDEHAPAVKILDMGLALLNEQKTHAHGDLTTTGQMMGTLEYMSPEQGLDTHNVDIRADIYSLGATLYKLLCGKAPFAGERYNTPGKLMVALATETPPSIGTQRNDLPAGLVAIVDRLLAREPADRPATPAEVAQALAPFASGADLRRLADAARNRESILDKTADQSITPTEQYLSSPGTGTSPTLKPEAQARDSRDSEAPARDSHQPEVPARNLTEREKPSLARRATVQFRNPKSAIRNPKWIAAVALGLLALVAVVFGIIKISTPDGDYVIQTDDPDFSFSVSQGVVTLRDKKTTREYTMKVVREQNGVFNLDVTDVGADLSFKTKEFTIKRGQQVALKAHFERMPAEVVNGPPAGDPDRRAAEWVLSIGSTIGIKETNGQERPIGAAGDLPRGAFELKSLGLHGNPKVTDAGLVNFQDCKNLRDLDLRNTRVSDVGLSHFKNCKNLMILYLNGLNFSDAGLANFKDCKNLTLLSLLGTKATDAGLAHFKDCKNLTHLNLDRTKVTDVGLAHFKDCKDLGQLDLANTEVSDAGLAQFKDCKNLTHLNLSTIQLSDAGLAQFKDCKNLTHLYLGRTQVSDAGFAHFKDYKNLMTLELNNTQVSDAGLVHLMDCKNLTTLSLNGTQVTDAKLSHFKDHEKLQHLYLNGTQVSDAGLAHFKEYKNLTHLDLDRTQVSDAGLEHLSGCPKLVFVIVKITKVTEAGVKKLSAALPGCKIEWDGGVLGPHGSTNPDRRAAEWAFLIGGQVRINDNGTERRIKSIGDLPRTPFELYSVHLEYNPNVTDEGLANFKDCHKLTFLALGNTKVTDAGFAYFKDCKNLVVLVLTRTQVGDAGLAYLGDFKNLANLQLRSTQVSDAGLAHLTGCTSLTSLDLTDTKLSDAGLAHVKECRNLTGLSLESTQVSDAGLVHLKDFKNLEKLNLLATKVSDAGLEHLSALTKLGSVNVIRTKVTEAGVKKLSAALPGCKIEWDGGVLGATDSPNPDRRAAEWVLSIGGSVLVNDQFANIKAATELPPEPFRLTGCDLIGNKKVTDAELAHFKDCKNLTSLHLSNTQVSDAGLAHVKDCKNLTFLDLSYIQMSDATLAPFKDCKNLTDLNLSNTQVSDAGLAHLKDCKNLKGVTLSWTRLSDAGLAQFNDYKNLTWVDLNGTKVSDAGLEHFAGCLTLGSVNVKNTKVTEAGVKKLSAALPGCKIEWDGGVLGPTDSTNPDRRAAEWVLSIGGRVAVTENGQKPRLATASDLPLGPAELSRVWDAHNRAFASLSDLPRGPFELTLVFLEQTQVNDADLAKLKECKNLTYLWLDKTQVTDAGLFHLKECRNLILLGIGDTRVTGAGLVHFKDFKNLAVLGLYKTPVGDAELAYFTNCKNIGILTLHETKLSDVSLERFADYPNLFLLQIKGTKVTEAGVKKLSAALPGCKIEWDGGVLGPTDPTKHDRHALSFDGTSSHVSIPTLKRDEPWPVTIEAWMSLEAQKDSANVVALGGKANCGLNSSGTGSFTYGGGLEKEFLGTPVEPGWVHLAFVADDQEGRLYLNGNEVDRSPRTKDPLVGNADEHAWLGAAEFPAGSKEMRFHFHGQLAEVRVSKIVRYREKFAPARRFEPDKDTLALYHFDEGQGDVLKDSSDNNHHGQIVEAKWVKASEPRK